MSISCRASEEQSDRIFAMLVERVIPDTPAQLCDDEVTWQVTERRLRGARIARIRPAPARTKLDLSSNKMLHPRTTAAVAEDFDDDEDEDRDESYYAGFGENSHYLRH